MCDMPARVLCVDDDAHVLAALRRQLRGRFDLVLAHGSAAALEALRDTGPFAVILADLHMPGMDGRTLLSAASALAPHAVGLLMTGDDVADATATPVVRGYVRKPCRPDVLWSLLDEAVAHYRQRTADA